MPLHLQQLRAADQSEGWLAPTLALKFLLPSPLLAAVQLAPGMRGPGQQVRCRRLGARDSLSVGEATAGLLLCHPLYLAAARMAACTTMPIMFALTAPRSERCRPARLPQSLLVSADARGGSSETDKPERKARIGCPACEPLAANGNETPRGLPPRGAWPKHSGDPNGLSRQ